ncbi:MAG: biopolymer transporter ExbD [Myxococcales bacterium]|nr:biopolymer transporter ExbD [Myxococcales bacterium]
MAGGTLGGGDDDEIITDINVTPLVDVVLVLLIILMVTATAIVSKTIPMELPQAATAETAGDTPTTLGISIDEGGNLFLDRDPMSEDELRARVRAAREASEDVRAIIAAAGSIQHGRVVQVIDLLRQERVTRFAINVRPSELEAQ